ncbi:MAG: YbaK/EbsC family protein [Nanoarchaeota archaeon]
METKVTKFLDQKGIKYIVKKHEHRALTCEMDAKERNCRISQIVKTMVGQDDKGYYHICLIPGDKILKLKKVRKEAGGIKINLADPFKIGQDLGLIIGAISPFIFPENTKFYIDPTVLNEEYVGVSSGDPLAGIELLSKDLVTLVDGKICDIISSHS